MVAVDTVDFGYISVQDAQALHCLCSDNERNMVEQACQNCLEVRLCQEIWKNKHGLTLCSTCATKSDILTEDRILHSVQQEVKRNAFMLHATLLVRYEVGWMVDGMMQELETQTVDKDHQEDAYDSIMFSIYNVLTDRHV